MCLLNSYHCRHLMPRRKHSITNYPAVRFSLNGHHFQIGLLTIPNIQTPLPDTITEKCVESTIENGQVAESDTQTFTQFAMLNVSPKTATHSEAKDKIPSKIDNSMTMWSKVKSLYKELGDMLQAHEKELEVLMK